MYMCRQKTKSACVHKYMCRRWRRGENGKNGAKQEHRCGKKIEGSVMDVYVWMCMSLLCCYVHIEGSTMDVHVCIYMYVHVYTYIYMYTCM